ncbi:MAG: hypothetical protein D6770_07365 [Anaerolineae bacterium]|nr:MAG: hypothetical protein D6770_07365 [Anaerolineae bacterium]
MNPVQRRAGILVAVRAVDGENDVNEGAVARVGAVVIEGDGEREILAQHHVAESAQRYGNSRCTQWRREGNFLLRSRQGGSLRRSDVRSSGKTAQEN